MILIKSFAAGQPFQHSNTTASMHDLNTYSSYKCSLDDYVTCNKMKKVRTEESKFSLFKLPLSFQNFLFLFSAFKNTFPLHVPSESEQTQKTFLTLDVIAYVLSWTLRDKWTKRKGLKLLTMHSCIMYHALKWRIICPFPLMLPFWSHKSLLWLEQYMSLALKNQVLGLSAEMTWR